jgi:hypothetical protein
MQLIDKLEFLNLAFKVFDLGLLPIHMTQKVPMIHLLEFIITIRCFIQVWEKPHQFGVHYLENRHGLVV